MLHTTRAIVLHTSKYRETSLLVTMYTEKFGIQKYIVKGVRGKSKKKGNANVFQSLFLLELEAYHKVNKEIQSLKEYRISSPFVSVPFDIRKSTQAQFLAEFLYRTIKEEEEHKNLFNYLFHSIQMLDLLDEGIGNFHLRFFLQLSGYLGYSTQNVGVGKWFDNYSEQFSKINQPNRFLWRENHLLLIHKLQELPFDRLNHIAMTSRDRETILYHIIQYFEVNLGFRIQLKSLDIFHDVFSS